MTGDMSQARQIEDDEAPLVINEPTPPASFREDAYVEPITQVTPRIMLAVGATWRGPSPFPDAGNDDPADRSHGSRRDLSRKARAGANLIPSRIVFSYSRSRIRRSRITSDSSSISTLNPRKSSRSRMISESGP